MIAAWDAWVAKYGPAPEERYRAARDRQQRESWPSRNPDLPHPGMVFYAGQWRTPGGRLRKIEAERAYQQTDVAQARKRLWETLRNPRLR